MLRGYGAKIRALRELLGEAQDEFGERFGVQQATVSRWEKEESPVARKYREAIASLANMSVTEFFYTDQALRLVPIAGVIEGREGVTPAGQSVPGGVISHIELGIGGKDQIGLNVVGDDWFPAYRHGDSVVAKKIQGVKIAQFLGRDCIVKIVGEDQWVLRILKSGTKPGRFTLRSLNPQEDDIEDVELEWAAPIVWIKRGD